MKQQYLENTIIDELESMAKILQGIEAKLASLMEVYAKNEKKEPEEIKEELSEEDVARLRKVVVKANEYITTKAIASVLEEEPFNLEDHNIRQLKPNQIDDFVKALEHKIKETLKQKP